MKQILAATDFSIRSQRALRRGGILARDLDAKLTLLHVVNDDQPESMVENDRRAYYTAGGRVWVLDLEPAAGKKKRIATAS